MIVKTTAQIWDMIVSRNDFSGKKWVCVDDLKKEIAKLRDKYKGSSTISLDCLKDFEEVLK